jgi:signal transduction histidine kinase
MVGEYLKADRVVYAEMAGENMIVLRDYTNGVPSLVGRYPPSVRSLNIRRARHDGGTYWVDDINTETWLTDNERKNLLSVGISAYIASCLHKNGEMTAAFTLNQSTPRIWTKTEIQLINEIAERVWAAVERARAEQALRDAQQEYRDKLEKEVEKRTKELKESRDQLQSIFDTTLVQMSILQAVRNDRGEIVDMEIKVVNKELEKETGRTDLPGKLYLQEYPGVKDVGLFGLIVKTIETGESQRMEYFYPHEGFYKWFSSMFVKLNDGVVASNMDITASKLAEERLRTVEAEQKREIFRASLETLEEERRRISESLHNGIGQLLYGVKISLENLDREFPEKDFESTKAYTTKLLSDAIIETRRISHELMPATLEEFGLKAAIDDVCHQLQDAVNFTCKVYGIKKRPEKYLELAIYRTIQELMINVVKHADATQAKVEVNIQPQQISLTVSDNGRGIKTAKGGKQGIGLTSIRSKIKLLNGDVKITSSKDKGTTVEVIVPLQNTAETVPVK